MQDHGDYPRAIGLSVWGTATMRTGGDDIAQALALIGVRPKWADGSHRVADFEILPMSLLDRPRIDVTLRVSGFFRDAFSNVIRLFDAAVQAVSELDEAEDVNPIRARIGRETAALVAEGMAVEAARRNAGHRIFGARAGAYGAGLQGLIDGRNWNEDADLATAYLNWGGHAYGQHDYGSDARDTFARRLAGIDLVMHNQDNREHDLLDSDDYYQFQGGMAAAVRHLSGTQPTLLFGDHANPQSPVVRSPQPTIISARAATSTAAASFLNNFMLHASFFVRHYPMQPGHFPSLLSFILPSHLQYCQCTEVLKFFQQISAIRAKKGCRTVCAAAFRA